MSADPKAPASQSVRDRLETLPPVQAFDAAAFGEVETVPLARLQQLGAGFLARNWLTIPHVTHHDEADITALEAYRKTVPSAAEGIKITLLPFLIKAVVAALKAFPRFNASLDASGKNLILKKYFHIGMAVDTPQGLLVPVLKDADKKSIAALAAEIVGLTEKARGKGLPLADMSGGCFTISSLGALGGTAFTPIINAPEVAILGVTKSQQKPQLIDGQTAWRLMLPLSLSYDHRVINGADAARFVTFLAQALADPKGLPM